MLQEVISGDSDNYAGTTSLTIFQTLQRATINVTATFYGEAGSTALRINTQSPYPLNMPEVRWAIQYAFNKQEMHNLWHRPPSLIPQDPFCLPVDIFASAFTKYLDEAEQASARLKADFGYEYKYDPEKAKQILDSLNFIDRDGDGIRETQNGTKLSFEVMFKEGLTDRLTSEILKESCQEVGIDIQFRLVDSAALESLTLLGQFEIWADSWGSNDEASRSDIFYRYYSFYSKNSNVSIGQQVLFSDRASRTRYWTPELDALLQQWQTLPDGNPALNDIIEQVFYLTGRDLSHIPVLYDRGLSVIYSTRYWYDFPSNVYQTNIQAADNYYITPAYWSSTCLQIVLQLKPVGVEYTSIWTAGNVSEFIGLDGKVYGPYVTGQYINNIPKEDADTLIASGKASLTQVIPGLESLEQSMQTLTGRAASLETSLSDVSNKVDNLGSQVNNVINYLTIGILGETVVLIILAVLLLSRRK
jgi:peptide/nickel transport system substrate-binding protein